jgi:hypothetical protein
VKLREIRRVKEPTSRLWVLQRKGMSPDMNLNMESRSIIEVWGLWAGALPQLYWKEGCVVIRRIGLNRLRR